MRCDDLRYEGCHASGAITRRNVFADDSHLADHAAALTSFQMASILVVEDVDDIREMVVETLRLEGYDVVEAEHGRRALELLDTMPEPPCLMILDLWMPVMSGVELLQILEQRGALAQLRVVVVSAAGQPPDAFPIHRFVRKPPSEELLLRLVRECCGAPPRPPAATV